MKNDCFIRACLKKATPYTPIWLMRQAGRYIPEYMELRKNHEIMDICKDPELSSQVSTMPIEMFDVDAAIIFEDLMVPLEPTGIRFKLVDKVGPVIEKPILTGVDIENIKIYDVEEVGFVSDTIKSLKQKVDVPVLGFAGGPFTMACYLIDGVHSENFKKTLSFMKEKPLLWGQLMEKLTTIVINYLEMQITAGADVIQLFDTWSGLTEKQEYIQKVFPYTCKIFEKLDKKTPKIHFTLDSSNIIETVSKSNCDVLGIGWKTDLSVMWSKIDFSKAIQGNLNPSSLASGGDTLKAETAKILNSVAGKTGHIFNLGHGILPETKPESVRELVDYVHTYNS